MAVKENYISISSIRNDKEEKIENLQRKIDNLEKDLFKSQCNNKKLEYQLKKNQEIITKYGKNTNNTSIPFFLPSEFKLEWENLIKNQLMESFESFWTIPEWLSHLIQDFFMIVYKETHLIINEKLIQILKVLDISYINEKVAFERYFDSFRWIFQENFSSLFCFNNQTYQAICIKLSELPLLYKNFDEMKIIFDREMSNNTFKYAIEQMYKLSVYMILHDPILTLNIEEYNKRSLNYYFFNKEKFITLEGFCKKDPCLIILNPPLINTKFPYQGMKTCVYILQDADSSIKEICIRNSSIPESKDRHSIKIEEEDLILENKDIQIPPLDYLSSPSELIFNEEVSKKQETTRNLNTDIETDKKCYDHPLSKHKNEGKNMTSSINEKGIYEYKTNHRDSEFLNEEELILNTETITMTNHEKLIEQFDFGTKSFSIEKKHTKCFLNPHNKSILSDQRNREIKKDILDEELRKKIKSPIIVRKNESSKFQRIHKPSSECANKGNTNRLEFHSKYSKEIPAVKFPLSKTSNLKMGKSKVVVKHSPILKKEHTKNKLTLSNYFDTSGSIRPKFPVDKSSSKVISKPIDRSNNLHYYLAYNESIKYDSASTTNSRKVNIPDRISNSKYSTFSKEKNLKL